MVLCSDLHALAEVVALSFIIPVPRQRFSPPCQIDRQSPPACGSKAPEGSKPERFSLERGAPQVQPTLGNLPRAYSTTVIHMSCRDSVIRLRDEEGRIRVSMRLHCSDGTLGNPAHNWGAPQMVCRHSLLGSQLISNHPSCYLGMSKPGALSNG